MPYRENRLPVRGFRPKNDQKKLSATFLPGQIKKAEKIH